MHTSRLWTKDFVLFAVANFFIGLLFYLLMTVMAVYAVEQFQASQSKAGLASSIFILAAVFSRLFAGKYLEVIGRRRLLLIGLIFYSLITLLYFPVRDVNVLLLVRFLHGAAFGCVNTAMATAVMALIPDDRRGEGTGYYSLSSTFATAIGPFLGITLAHAYGYESVFAVCTGFTLVGLVIMLFCRIPEAQLTKEQFQRMKTGWRIDDFIEFRALPLAFVMIIMGIGYSSIVSFLNSYAIEIGLEKAAGYFFIVYSFFLLLSRPIAGRLLDRRGDNIVMYPGILFFTLSLLVVGLAHNGFTLLAAGAMTALGFGTLMTSAQAIVVRMTPRHRVALATSTFFICLDGGMGIGPYLIGLLIPHVHFRGMYVVLAALVFLSVFLYYGLHGRKAAASSRRLLESRPADGSSV
jgi:MFS family permease